MEGTIDSISRESIRGLTSSGREPATDFSSCSDWRWEDRDDL